MAIHFAESGGQYHYNSVAAVGVWANASGVSIINTAPAYNGNTYAYFINFGNNLTTPVLGTGIYTGLIVGTRIIFNNGGALATHPFLYFYDHVNNLQCSLGITSTGLLYFSDHNGTQLGGFSAAVTLGAWVYVECKMLFGSSSNGTCEVKVNGVTLLTVTSCTNAQNGNGGGVIEWFSQGFSLQAVTDFYVLDTVGGANTTYLGDVTIGETYLKTAGVNAAWALNVSPWTVTSVANASGGNTVYTMSGGNGGGTNTYQGYNIVMSGFGVHAADNGTYLCVASTATTLTLNNPSGVSTDTGTANFQNPLQIGIEGGLNTLAITNNGTRPNGDAVYLTDATPNDISDFGHEQISLTGIIYGIVHVTYARKDDAGARSIAQTCISGGSTELGSTQALGSAYQYYQDILEVDPHTSSAWTVSGFNAATFGVKEIA